MHEFDVLSTIGLYIITATVFAVIAKYLRQPLILAYLGAGVFLGGNLGLGLVQDPEIIKAVSEIGLILLLFIIGLEIDLKKLLASGRIIIAAGVSQFLLCVALALGFALLAGFVLGGGRFDALYLAVALSLSSTMIVVKLLYDKFELATLPGRITLGILVFQDIWAIAFLAVQPNLNNPELLLLTLSLAEGALLVGVSLAASRYLLPRLFASAATRPELVLILAISWCFLISNTAGLLGLSREMGALIAGVSLSTFPYNVDVIAKVTSIRDFFVILFFVGLGMLIPSPDAELLLLAAVITTALVLIRLATMFPVLYGMSRDLRVSLVPCINLSQVSEFSLVILVLGQSMGHVDQRLMSLVIVCFALTSVLSTYAIQYSHPLQKVLARVARFLGLREMGDSQECSAQDNGKSIVFLGFYRETSSIFEELEHLGRETGRPDILNEALVVDFNIRVYTELKQRGVACVYGDLANMDTLHHARLSGAKVVVSSIQDLLLLGTSNLRLLKVCRRLCPQAQALLTAETIPEALRLYEQGADFVFLPRLHSAQHAAQVILAGLNGGMTDQGQAEARDLRQRREVLP